uniref:Uncharacterized protein n=1 Tax=Rhizophora mucronata TaxID=61149 RepID=A0A2P2NVL8_RHIMU
MINLGNKNSFYFGYACTFYLWILWIYTPSCFEVWSIASLHFICFCHAIKLLGIISLLFN